MHLLTANLVGGRKTSTKQYFGPHLWIAEFIFCNWSLKFHFPSFLPTFWLKCLSTPRILSALAKDGSIKLGLGTRHHCVHSGGCDFCVRSISRRKIPATDNSHRSYSHGAKNQTNAPRFQGVRCVLLGNEPRRN